MTTYTTDNITPADTDRALDYLREHHSRNSFYTSLFQQFSSKGSLSVKQIVAVLNGIERDRTRQRDESQAVANPVTEEGMYRTNGTVYRIKRTRDGERLYATRFVPDATVKSERFVYDKGAIHRISADDRMTPEQAEELGALYGVCVVCGAELTDPQSVARGIGPVCRKRV